MSVILKSSKQNSGFTTVLTPCFISSSRTTSHQTPAHQFRDFWYTFVWPLTGGPGSPFSPGGPASSENWVGSRSNVWKPSVATGVTAGSAVGLKLLVTSGSGFLGATVVSSFSRGTYACVEKAVVLRFDDGLTETGRSKLFPEAPEDSLSLWFAFLTKCFWSSGFMIRRDAVTVGDENLGRFSNPTLAGGEMDTTAYSVAKDLSVSDDEVVWVEVISGSENRGSMGGKTGRYVSASLQCFLMWSQ